MSQEISENRNEMVTVERDVKASAIHLSGGSGGLVLDNLGAVMAFAQVMSRSSIGVRKHLRENPGACTAVCLQAFEWEMSPFAVANKSYLVNDQIAYESQLLHAVILRRAPIKGRIKTEYSGDGATRRIKVWAVDKNDETMEYLSPEFKDIAVKNSPLWKADPDQQFHYYGIRAFARRHFPDVILGVYERDEVETLTLPTGEYREVQSGTAQERIAKKLDQLAGEPAADPETGEVEIVKGTAADWEKEQKEKAKRHRRTKAEMEAARAAEAAAAQEAAPAQDEYLAGIAARNEPASESLTPQPTDVRAAVEESKPFHQIQAEKAAGEFEAAKDLRAVEDVYEAWRDPSDKWPEQYVNVLEMAFDKALGRFGKWRDDQGDIFDLKQAGPAAQEAAAPSVEEDPRQIAFDRGVANKKAGMPRKAIPGEYRAEGREDELSTYLEGFDTAQAAA